jgi:hypothetical protein
MKLAQAPETDERLVRERTAPEPDIAAGPSLWIRPGL